MTDQRQLPGCLILTGVPGAGKTTVSGLVADGLPRAACINADVVSAMIVNGGVGPVREPADEAQRQLRLRARNVCSLADNFAAAGFVPVIDHVIPDRAALDFMARCLRTRPMLFVVLAPPLEVSRHRNVTRDVQERVDYDYSDLEALMRAELTGQGWWLDTGGLTPVETATRILAHAHEYAEIRPWPLGGQVRSGSPLPSRPGGI